MMRCFTDAELRRGIVAVRLAHPEANLVDVFLLATETEREETNAFHTRSDGVSDPDPEPTRRPDR
jgi:hypothetical protein